MGVGSIQRTKREEKERKKREKKEAADAKKKAKEEEKARKKREKDEAKAAKKGLPPPKSGKDSAAVAFLEAFHQAGDSWEHFLALVSPAEMVNGNSCREGSEFPWPQ